MAAMKISIVSHSDTYGGASKAAYRLHVAVGKEDVISNMLVKIKATDDESVITTNSGLTLFISRLLAFLSNKICLLQRSKSPNLHSLNIIGSFVSKLLDKEDCNVVNIHWVNGETLSIKQISEIKKPIVMTLHDMWAFCGSEHLSNDTDLSQFRIGYHQESNDADYISGLNINRFVWRLKRKFWVKPFIIVTPSRWMSNCVRDSILFSGWNVHTIPNALDTNKFQPTDKLNAREILNLPQDKKLIGFGAISGTRDPNKGFDLLEKSLSYIDRKNDYCCVVVGEQGESKPTINGIQVIYLGYLTDESKLALFYSAIDVMVVPSRIESLSQTATEAQSCGTPVASFNSTGLLDVVEHKKTGYLALPFDSQDLANGIMWCVDNSKEINEACRYRAVTLWSEDVIAKKYIEVYKRAIESSSL
ncbi:glycosyltransferase [Vibrio cincinnatiensis]